jgi:hypothetical protein
MGLSPLMEKDPMTFAFKTIYASLLFWTSTTSTVPFFSCDAFLTLPVISTCAFPMQNRLMFWISTCCLSMWNRSHTEKVPHQQPPASPCHWGDRKNTENKIFLTVSMWGCLPWPQSQNMSEELFSSLLTSTFLMHLLQHWQVVTLCSYHGNNHPWPPTTSHGEKDMPILLLKTCIWLDNSACHW